MQLQQHEHTNVAGDAKSTSKYKCAPVSNCLHTLYVGVPTVLDPLLTVAQSVVCGSITDGGSLRMQPPTSKYNNLPASHGHFISKYCGHRRPRHSVCAVL
uniref:Uncharacterized protein n=1 Tax=Lygus hesperus TaxID=30085 RepID=A0A146LCZ8_LYGHE